MPIAETHTNGDGETPVRVAAIEEILTRDIGK